MSFANAPEIVASGSVHNKMLPVSIVTFNIKTLDAMNPKTDKWR